ncbi:hypothetical protein F4604DRAFT_1941881 [Suillus subluteus]|nr:hypothetical protein F4604DRAFT_1941881 [Suillus subluteus]
MQQSSCQTFKLQGYNINLNLRIEIPSSANQKEELAGHGVSDTDVDKNCHPAWNSEAPLMQVKSHEAGGVDREIDGADSITKLKERLELAELHCSKFGELYQKYRLRWLEENHRARVLEKYAPSEIDTCSARQIPWDAPSPVQSDNDDDDDDDKPE